MSYKHKYNKTSSLRTALLPKDEEEYISFVNRSVLDSPAQTYSKDFDFYIVQESDNANIFSFALSVRFKCI
jgi:hypothetical protein